MSSASWVSGLQIVTTLLRDRKLEGRRIHGFKRWISAVWTLWILVKGQGAVPSPVSFLGGLSFSTSVGSRDGITSHSNPANDPISTSPPKANISVIQTHVDMYVYVQNAFDNTAWVKPGALHTWVRKWFL